jgi:hypothetical protein
MHHPRPELRILLATLVKEGGSTGAMGVTVWKALEAINEPEMSKNQRSSSPALGQQLETSSALRLAGQFHGALPRMAKPA